MKAGTAGAPRRTQKRADPVKEREEEGKGSAEEQLDVLGEWGSG